MLNKQSVYLCIYDLIQGEKKKLWPDIDANDIDVTFKKLVDCSNHDFGEEVEDWVNWFVNDEQNDDVERQSIRMMWEIYCVENRCVPKIREAKKKLGKPRPGKD